MAGVAAVTALFIAGGLTAAADDAAARTALDLDAKGSITVTKYAQSDAAATELDPTPGQGLLDGVEYTLRQVSIDPSTRSDWASGHGLDPYLGNDMATAGSAAYSLDVLEEPLTAITGGTGFPAGVAVFDDLDVGIYLVEETSLGAHPSEHRAAPFYVAVPQPHSGGGWLYDVNVYPRNAVTGFEIPCNVYENVR